MLADLAALTPPLVVGGVFLIGVVLFLRRQMSPERQAVDDDAEGGIPDAGRNADPSDAAHGSSADQHKVQPAGVTPDSSPADSIVNRRNFS